MIPRGYLWTLRILNLLSIAALGYVIVYVDPGDGTWTKAVFYSALFVCLALFFNLVLLRLRSRKMEGSLVAGNMALSFRQGILLSVLVIALLVLQSFRMLVWWDGLLAAGGIFIVEFYFLSRAQ
ncbi:MAG: hypothetical protein HGB08_04100 [Candidatus Moranbacteria bacterium]|nr:hypothetical protein [Candidatus Moranbacteria bacterium]